MNDPHTVKPTSYSSTYPIKVGIVEDQPEIREGLKFLIQNTEGYQCTGSFESMEAALQSLGSDLPNIVLADIGLPGMSGIDGARLLKERWPELVVIALTVYDDDERIFDALCAGASGYLLKKTPPARLIECLKEAMNGGAPMSPEVASASSSLNFGVEPLQFHASVFDPELPVDATLFGIGSSGPSCDLGLQFGQIAETAVAQTLARQATQFAFGDV